MTTTYDLATIQPRGTVFLFTLAEPYRSGTYVSGPLKAIQNFIAELFTDAGTVRFSPTFGCRFARETRGVNAVAITDIRGALARGIDQIRINQRYRQRGTAPRDEMIDRVNILGLQQLQDRVIASLSFTMESGEDTTIHLPISLEPN